MEAFRNYLNLDNVHSALQFTKHVHILILKVGIE